MVNTYVEKKINPNISSNSDLWELYSKNRSLKIRNRLVEINLDLARKLAHSIHRRNQSLIYEDIEQQAFIALIYCVENYQLDKGFRFSTYAVPVINGRLLNYIRDKTALIRIPRRILKDISEFNRNGQSLNRECKDAQNEVKSCRYLKELIGNEAIVYEGEEQNKIVEYTPKLEVIFTDEDKLTVLNILLNKKRLQPMEALTYRSLCKKNLIQFKNFL